MNKNLIKQNIFEIYNIKEENIVSSNISENIEYFELDDELYQTSILVIDWLKLYHRFICTKLDFDEKHYIIELD